MSDIWGGRILMDKIGELLRAFLVNFCGHFLMVITNSVNTVGQLMQGVPLLG